MPSAAVGKTGFVVSVHGLINITLLVLWCKLVRREVADLFILNEDTHPVIREIEVSRTACKYEFRRNLRSPAVAYCISRYYRPFFPLASNIIRWTVSTAPRRTKQYNAV